MRRVRRCRGEDGSAALDAVILLPVVFLALALIAVAGRQTGANNTVEHAANAAARAAAGAQTMGGAQQRAATVASSTTSETCASAPTVSVGGSVEPGGTVTVTVTCTAQLGDHGARLGIGTTRTLSATASQPVDSIRGGP